MENSMTEKKVLIIGAGGLGRETLNIYIDSGRENEVLGFLDEDPKLKGKIINEKPVYDFNYLNEFSEDETPHLVVALGYTKRDNLIKKLSEQGYRFDTIIHPSCVYSKWVEIGEGSIITAGVILTAQIEMGKHVILNLGAHVGHDVQIGNYVTISPSAEIMGNVSLGNNVYVAVNATIIEGITVGDGAIIGAGAVVTKDVPEMSMVAGVPAKVKKIYNSVEEKPW
jgi:sugar O-acyltransferase (sialic acid O-acetyltransferase NeuD family)